MFYGVVHLVIANAIAHFLGEDPWDFPAGYAALTPDVLQALSRLLRPDAIALSTVVPRERVS